MSEKQEEARFGLSPQEAALALRRLAERLEAGELDFGGTPVSLEQIKRIKISLSPGPEGIAFEQKLKVHRRDSPAVPAGELKFKPLKKRMRRTFKAMRAMVEEGHPPPVQMVERFVADTDRMCELAKVDDPAYQEFRDELERFQASVAQGESESLESRLQTLRAMEHACHARYD